MMNDVPLPERDTPLLPWEDQAGGLTIRDAAEALSQETAGESDNRDEDEPTPEGEPEGEQEADEEVEASADEDADAEEPEEEDGDEEELIFEWPDGTQATLAEVEEWRKSGLRQADYTRKTQAVAEQRKAVEAAHAEAAQHRDEYLTRLQAVQSALQAGAPPERTPDDWDRLRQSNPQEFQAEWVRTQRYNQQQQLLEVEQQRVREEAQQAFQQQHSKYLEEERAKLYDAIPEWKENEEQAQQDKATLAAFAQERYGFTKEELEMVGDHRLMLLLRDAHRFNVVEQKAAPTVRSKGKAPKVVQGSGKTRTKRNSQAKIIRAQKAKLARSGSAEDAVALLEAMSGG